MIKRFKAEEIFLCTSDICTAFDKRNVIGSKVLDWPKFNKGLIQGIVEHDSSKDRVPGQHFIVLPESLHQTVLAGDGPKSDNPNDYVIRKHREGPKMFLKRIRAGKTKSLAVVVYTVDAYLSDPDITEREAERIKSSPALTHVVVAVIASSGPESPVTPFRFVHNLAGGNKEYQCPPWDYNNQDSSEIVDTLANHIEFLEDKACAVRDYWTKWSVVAD